MKSSAVLLALLSGLVSAGVAQVRAASGTGTGTSTGTDAIASTNTNTKTTPPWAQPPKSQSRSACRCFPGDACWPSAATWKSFNDTVGGRLIATVPLASPCHHDAFAPYDAGACQSLQAQWFSPALHEESPSSIMAPYFTNNSCNPFLPPDAPCVVGSYVSYSVNVAGPQDVARTLWFANYFNIRIVVKNTGHDYSGKSTGAGAIGIWTHNLAGVSFVDYQSDGYTGKAVRAAAGVQMSQVYDSASAVGLAVVGGESASVGYVGGYTQGGGHSAMSSRYGLAADQVLEWEVVDGRGRILKATPKENPDLYWALCGGGGGTYGVVTSMTSKAYPDVPVVGANVSFASAGVTQDQFYDVLSTFQASLPDIVDAGAMAVWFFSNESFALSPVTAPGLTEDKVKQLLKPLTDKLDSYNMTYASVVTTFPGFNAQFNAQVARPPVGVGLYGSRLIPRSVVRDKNADLTAAYRYINQHGGLVAGLGMNVSKKVAGPVHNAVNPAWRDTLIHNIIQTPYDYTVPLSDMKAAQDQITNVLVPQLSKLTPGGGAYLNEADFQQPDWQHVFYGSNYDALKRVKNCYDPYHIFYATTAVGSEYWVPRQDGRLCKSSA